MLSPTERISRERLLALLAALSLFLSTLEFLIPKPIPFFKIGLANLPIIIGVYLLGPLEFLVLLVLKVLGQGLVNGTLFSYVFLLSLGSSFASGGTMQILFRLFRKRISPVGLSMGGALASNLMQLWIARLLLFGAAVDLFRIPLLLIGGITSIILGVFSLRFMEKSRWFSARRNAP